MSYFKIKIAPVQILVIAVSLYCLLLPSTLIFGASDNFTIRTLIGNDTTPPTTPTSFVATPVAISQINLSWASSTDNFNLSGYQVWRDGVQIATTTAIFYYDTSLTASTTYVYYVTAFDSFFNFSTSSVVATATTLSIPSSTPTPTTTPASGSTQGSLMRSLEDEILSLEILPQRDSVIIRYTTKNHVRSVAKWGRGISYELGSLSENIFNTQHEIKIVGLIPGSRYQFILEGENKFGRYGVMHVGTFVTLEPEDTFPPGNVTNLHAEREGDTVTLSWANPEDADFTKVRVVRSDKFYPSDPVDGWVVYEGRDSSVRDTEGASLEGRLYYTIFSYDALGNISSGAVVSLSPQSETSVSEDVIVDPTLNEISLQFNEIQFGQEGVLAVTENGQVAIDGTKQLTIAIPYDRLPEHLKTILVTIHDSQNSTRSFNFLLRANKEKTAYISTVAPFGTSGNFPIMISIFDFKTSQIGYTDGTLVSRINIHREPDSSGITGFMKVVDWFSIFLIIVFVIGLMYLGRRILRTEW